MRLTNEEFINRIKNNHPKLYEEIDILEEFNTIYHRICVMTKYGKCNPKANSLLKGDFPSILSAIDKTEYYINKCIEKHGILYDYSKCVYTDISSDIILICEKHGEFVIKAGSHLRGSGCLDCHLDKISAKNPNKHDEFVKNLKLKNKEIYDLIEIKGKYCGSNKKILIGTKFGDCNISPDNLIKRKTTNSLIKSAVDKTKFFINMSKEIHGDRYDYSKTKYISDDKYVTITCNRHGDFEQIAGSHLLGYNCKDCSVEDSSTGCMNKTTAQRNKENWINITAQLYIIKCHSIDESFYKIGVTKNTIYDRFYCKSIMPYKYEIINSYKTNLYEAVILEGVLHQIHSDYKYFPKIKFGGHTECFYSIDINKIKEVVDFG